jgi:hypothetical protein
MKRFKVIEVTINEHDGDSYEYVTKIDVNQYGQITILTSSNVLNAMKFSDYVVENDKEKSLHNQLLNLVKVYFPKKNHTIQYRSVTIEIK